MIGPRKHSAGKQVISQTQSYFMKNITNIIYTEIPLNFRDLMLKILHIPFSQAAHYIKVCYLSFLFCLYEFKNRINTFLLRISDEAARIYDNCFCGCVLRIIDDIISSCAELVKKLLRINDILGAAKSDYIDFIIFHCNLLAQMAQNYFHTCLVHRVLRTWQAF